MPFSSLGYGPHERLRLESLARTHPIQPAHKQESGTAESPSRLRSFVGSAVMLLAEYGASFHPATAAQFYADKAAAEAAAASQQSAVPSVSAPQA